jgi:hypothetical protein
MERVWGMYKYIIWFRDRSVFILIALAILYVMFKPAIQKIRYRLREVHRRIYNRVFKGVQPKPDITTYSVDDSIKYGFRDSAGAITLKRPNMIVDNSLRGMHMFDSMIAMARRLNTTRTLTYRIADRRVIPLSYLHDYPNKRIWRKTLRVYVEEVYDDIATLRDHSAVYKLKMGTCYPLAGELVMINISKKGDEVKVHKILNDSKALVNMHKKQKH